MIKKKLRLLYNDTMNELFSAGRFLKSEIAQNRLKVVEFSNKYGIKLAQDAFGVSRATIFRWRRYLREAQGRLDSLIPKLTRPKKVRTMKVNPETVTFIRGMREKHPRIGKKKINLLKRVQVTKD